MMPALKYLRIASHEIDPSSGPKKLLPKPQSSLVDYGVYLIIILFSHGKYMNTKLNDQNSHENLKQEIGLV